MPVDREVLLILPPVPPHGVRGEEPWRTSRISSRTEEVCSTTCWLVKRKTALPTTFSAWRNCSRRDHTHRPSPGAGAKPAIRLQPTNPRGLPPHESEGGWGGEKRQHLPLDTEHGHYFSSLLGGQHDDSRKVWG